jgi:uncharacterized membrane protein YqiK
MKPLIFPLVFMALASFSVLRYYCLVGFPSTFRLLPYQVGLLFRRGLPVRELGPGSHRVFPGSEKILFLDNRPIQVNVENRAVILADGAAVVYGFTASAQVVDVKKATYASSNYNHLPSFKTLCAVRAALNHCKASRIVAGRAEIQEEIAANCKSRLAAVGFELLSFRITQLNIASPTSSVS